MKPGHATPANPVPGTPIMPRVHAPLRTLGIAMAVMCYLACLALGGLLLIERAVNAWTADIQGEVTVQVREIAKADQAAETEKALAVLKTTAGVVAARRISRADARKLLEPWLGRSKLIDEMPIPELIAVKVDAANPPDFVALEKALKDTVKGASLDTHRRWQAELASTGTMLQWLGFAILLVIVASAVALVVYASRTALEANRDVIEVLYLVGARDRFIVAEAEKRFLMTGLKAGLAGVAGAILTYGLVALTDVFGSPSDLAAAARGLLFGPIEETYTSYLIFLGLPVITTFLSMLTARFAVFRILKDVF